MDMMNCKNCNKCCIKKGGCRYYCKVCRTYHRKEYKNHLLTEEEKKNIIRLSNEGLGIRSIGRYLRMSASNVINVIIKYCSGIERRVVVESDGEYEIDEMQTYIGKNEASNYCWIVYAINRNNRQVVDYVVGKRTVVGLLTRNTDATASIFGNHSQLNTVYKD